MVERGKEPKQGGGGISAVERTCVRDIPGRTHVTRPSGCNPRGYRRNQRDRRPNYFGRYKVRTQKDDPPLHGRHCFTRGHQLPANLTHSEYIKVSRSLSKMPAVVRPYSTCIGQETREQRRPEERYILLAVLYSSPRKQLTVERSQMSSRVLKPRLTRGDLFHYSERMEDSSAAAASQGMSQERKERVHSVYAV